MIINYWTSWSSSAADSWSGTLRRSASWQVYVENVSPKPSDFLINRSIYVKVINLQCFMNGSLSTLGQYLFLPLWSYLMLSQGNSFASVTTFRPSICCVTPLTGCSSHSEEPTCPLSLPGIRGPRSTLRFFSQRCLATSARASMSEHRLSLCGKLDYSPSAATSMPVASFSVFSRCRATS